MANVSVTAAADLVFTCWICRCRLPSWIQRLEHFTQNALREGDTTTTTLGDSHTGHLTNATSVPRATGRRSVRFGPPTSDRNVPLADRPKPAHRDQFKDLRTAPFHRS